VFGALAFGGEGRLAIEPVHRRIERRMGAALPVPRKSAIPRNRDKSLFASFSSEKEEFY